MTRALLFGGLVIALSACSSTSSTAPSAGAIATPIPTPSPTPSAPAVRVLIVTATAGFRHDSIATARQAMSSLAAASGVFTVTSTEDLATITSANLANFEVVCFALTSGELPLNVDQRSALLAFVSGGGGFIGAHSATDTFYDWPEYGRLIGAYFKEHPWTRIGLVEVENSSHPINGGSVRFSINEEFYTFRDNPRANTTVLWRLDAASVGASGDYPLAWAHAYGSGRVYYNALGHFSATWLDSSFQRHLIAAIQWVAKRTG